MKENPSTVLIVCHGSRSKGWVATVEDWFTVVSSRLSWHGVQAELSYLEITEPSFESKLRELGAGSLSIFPFFLTQSGHAGEEIPELVSDYLGPDHHIRFIEPDGWADLLGRNAQRRLESYGASPGCPIVVSGYGASSHGHVWMNLMKDIRRNSGSYAAGEWLFAPSGHFQDDHSAPLRDALERLCENETREAAILPLYLSISSYQKELIPEVMRAFPDIRIAFEPDAILPDDAVAEWAVKLIVRSVGADSAV